MEFQEKSRPSRSNAYGIGGGQEPPVYSDPNIFRRLTGKTGKGTHGPSWETRGGWAEPKPWDTILPNGIFRNVNGEWWQFFKFPSNINIDWSVSASSKVQAQSIITDLVNELGSALSIQGTKTKNDDRRSIHILAFLDEQKGITGYRGETPATRDYFDRMGDRFSRPIWSGYMGVKLKESSIYSGSTTVREYVSTYLEWFKSPESFKTLAFDDDIYEIESYMLGSGFRPLDFERNPEDLQKLTAWYAQEDEVYNIPRDIAYARLQEPTHGASIITPRFGEVQMMAIKAREGLFIPGAPTSPVVQWSDPLFLPETNVVAVSIRSDIRSANVADQVFAKKAERRYDRAASREMDESVGYTEARKASVDAQRSDIAQQATAGGHALMDNTEILIATKVNTDGRENPLSRYMRNYGLEVSPLIGRQPVALMNTLPTYPETVFPVNRRSNNRRSPLSNVVLPGVIAMSGLFRSARPCADHGVLLGFADQATGMPEIYTPVDAAATESATPTMLISGRSGAGKTMQMIQMSHQIVNQEYRLFFLNPKTGSDLSPSFKHMGAIIVSMDADTLADSPGLLDPMLFIDRSTREGRASIQTLLVSAISMAVGLNVRSRERAQEDNARRASLATQIHDRIEDPRNLCSGDVLFGRLEERREAEDNPAMTAGIGDTRAKDVIRDRMNTSPFWKSFVSKDPNVTSGFRDQLMDGRPVLVQWGSNLTLPTVDKAAVEYSESEVDSILSITSVFKYASEIVAHQHQGGAIIVDEAWILRNSEDAMQILNKGMREWRELNIMLVLGTQKITDFIGDDKGNKISSFISRYLFMAINRNDDDEYNEFLRLSGMEHSDQLRSYMENAGVKDNETDEHTNLVARAFYVDNIYGYSGGIICGPWPLIELNAARTDVEAKRERALRGRMGLSEGPEEDSLFGEVSNIINHGIGMTTVESVANVKSAEETREELDNVMEDREIARIERESRSRMAEASLYEKEGPDRASRIRQQRSRDERRGGRG